METIQIDLNISDDRAHALHTVYDQVKEQAEKLRRVKPDTLRDLAHGLSEVIAGQPVLTPLLADIKSGGDRFYHLNLRHPHPEILNMPWETAMAPHLDRPIMDIPQLLVSRATPDIRRPRCDTSAGPLKILIMTSLPKDLQSDARLQVEREERAIVRSFEELFRSGEVSIDFTFNGSLNALREKIDRNNYHILHFTGHGLFDQDKKEGRLLLEDPLTLEGRPVSGADFAKALIKDGHTIPLVMLSACQTGVTDETAWQGVCQAVLQKGIPAVVAMAMSIKDWYASEFAACFYRRLSEKNPLVQAFKDAKQAIRTLEHQENLARHIPNTAPFQWMIPVLYSEEAPEPVDWSHPFEAVKPERSTLVFQGATLRKSETDDFFVGRREDFGRVMPLVQRKRAVLLTGQGGIGKSTLAKKVMERLSLQRPGLKAFLFNEEGKELFLTGMLDQLETFCFHHDLKNILAEPFYEKQTSVPKKIAMLMTEIGRQLDALFLFDNMETFQNNRQGPIVSDHQDLIDLITHGLTQTELGFLFTGRYDIEELKDLVEIHSLNDVIESDFIVKCYNLGLRNLTVPQLQFLYQTLGGNFRAVEFFFEAFSQKPEQMQKAFADLEAFKASAKEATESAMIRMAENLFFNALFKGLEPTEKRAAAMMAHYTLPVLDVALLVQDDSFDAHEALAALKRRTLIQAYYDAETRLIYYFMPPLVQDLGRRNDLFAKMDQAFHERAGRYHEYMLKSVCRGRVPEQDAAFCHYEKAGALKKMAALGESLANFYYARALYRESARVAKAMYQAASANPPFWCLNRLVMIGVRVGNYKEAEHFAKLALKSFETPHSLSRNDKEDLGATLNNMATVTHARGDYDTALGYLQQSLKIRKEIGDKKGEGATLNNISQIYDARGDYDTALGYLQQSLKISKEIGDKKGEGVTLNNISQIHKARGDYDTALGYLQQSLKIRKEIGDIAGEAVTAFNMAHICENKGDLAGALGLAQRTVRIDLQTGHPDLQSDASYLMRLMMAAHRNGLDFSKLLDPQVLALLSSLAQNAGK